VQKSGFQSEVRAAAAISLLRECYSDGSFKEGNTVDFYKLSAMTAKVFNAGVCDNFAATGAFAYGALAKGAGRPSGEKVEVVFNNYHVWVEVNTPGSQNVVIDPWTDGPAVLAEDARFANNRAGISKKAASFDIAAAAEANDWTEATASSVRERKERVDEHLQKCEEAAAQATDGLFKCSPPLPVLSHMFIGRTLNRVMATGDPWKAVVAEVQAVGVAKSLGAERVPVMLADAAKIKDVMLEQVGLRVK
jgi:hypothetical protein